jgi:hypothetical protein
LREIETETGGSEVSEDILDPGLDIIPRYVYGIQSGQFIKIGVANDIERRLAQMKLLNPHPCSVVFRRKIPCALYCERQMHDLLKAKSIGREWFEVTLQEVRAASLIAIANTNKVFRKRKIIDRQHQRDLVLAARASGVPLGQYAFESSTKSKTS